MLLYLPSLKLNSLTNSVQVGVNSEARICEVCIPCFSSSTQSVQPPCALLSFDLSSYHLCWVDLFSPASLWKKNTESHNKFFYNEHHKGRVEKDRSTFILMKVALGLAI